MTTTLQTTWTTDTPLHEKIIEVVADCWQVKPEQIKAPERGEINISDARHIAASLIKKYNPEMSLKNIGQILGGRDHSTVIYCLRVVEELCGNNKDFRMKYQCSKAVIDNILEDENHVS